MTAKKQEDNTPDVETPNPSEEQMAGDVQEQVDQEQSKGYLGTAVDQTPNEEYALTSGPDSPPAHGDDRTRSDQTSATDTTKE